MRSATQTSIPASHTYADFNSHAPCGARHDLFRFHKNTIAFQLTRSMRSATVLPTRRKARISISTHTLHAERDHFVSLSPHVPSYFNSHAPCGARQAHTVAVNKELNFNSHAPCGARLDVLDALLPVIIDFNSHAPCGARRCRAF